MTHKTENIYYLFFPEKHFDPRYYSIMKVIDIKISTNIYISKYPKKLKIEYNRVQIKHISHRNQYN